MVDLDLKDFADEKKNGKAILDRTLSYTLKSIKESIEGHPTVLFTGNGYHVYQLSSLVQIPNTITTTIFDCCQK